MKDEIKKKLKEFWKAFDGAAKEKATEIVEYELYELQNIFAIVVIGSFVGMPAPPMQISLDLLPFMDEELIIMMDKISTANSPMADLASIMDLY